MTHVVADSLEMTKFINLLSENGNRATFDTLKSNIIDNEKINIKMKEDDNLAIFYSEDIPGKEHTPLERSCKSIIIEKDTLRIIGSQYNPIIYNYDALYALNNLRWGNVVIYKCYEGTTVLVFYHNDKWYISTRRCLNAEGFAGSNKDTFKDLFLDAMEGKFTFEDLHKNYCYHFILVHHKVKGIVTYSDDPEYEYKYIYCTLVTKKYTLNEVNISVEGTRYIKKVDFRNVNSLMKHIDCINRDDMNNKKISLEGYIVKYYKGDVHKSPFVIYKIQTYIYQRLSKIRANNSNINQCYLEMYQKNNFKEISPYFTKYNVDIMQRINYSLKTISKEFLDIYHATRNKKNPDIYDKLTGMYKYVLYKIHGLYIKNRNDDFKNGYDENKFKIHSKAITKFNIYDLLKKLDPQELRQVFYDRMKMINIYKGDDSITYFNNCSYTSTQTMLMFGNIFTS